MCIRDSVWLASGPTGRARATALGVAECLAAFGAFVLYYRHFVTDVLGLIGRLAGTGGGSAGASAASVYPVEGFWTVFLERTGSFFAWPYLLLAGIGLVVSRKRMKEKGLLATWGLAYVVLILLRARIPDVFRYGHETLLVTPLVCLAAGESLAALTGAGRVRRVLGGVLLAALALEGFALQWRAVAEQLGNAL